MTEHKINCIFHIGTEKTGSTTLQIFLEKNRLNFLSRKIFVAPTYINHALYPLNKETLNSFSDEIADSNPSTVVFSNEHLSWLNAKEIAEVKTFFDIFFATSSAKPDYEIIAYLRPQHELAISRYSTALRMGLRSPSLLPRTVDPKDIKYNYQIMLSGWSQSFGVKNIRPQPIESIPARNVCADFCKKLNVDFSQTVEVLKKNEALDSTTQSFLEFFNRERHAVSPIRTPFERNKLTEILELLENEPALNLTSSPRLPGRQEAESFYSTYAASNEAVRNTWLSDTTHLFQPDFEKYPTRTTQLSRDLRVHFRLFAHLWTRLTADLHKKDFDIQGLWSALEVRLQHVHNLEKANAELRTHAKTLLDQHQDRSDDIGRLQQQLSESREEVHALRADLDQTLQTLLGTKQYVSNLEATLKKHRLNHPKQILE